MDDARSGRRRQRQGAAGDHHPIAGADALWNAGVDGECEFTQVGGGCDCPEADGFAFIDNLCTWNYL